MKDKKYYLIENNNINETYKYKVKPNPKDDLYKVKKLKNHKFKTLKANPFNYNNNNGVYSIVNYASNEYNNCYSIIEEMISNNIDYNKLILSIENNIEVSKIIKYIENNYLFDIDIIKTKGYDIKIYNKKCFEDYRDKFDKIIELIKNDKYINELYELNHGI